MVKLKSRPEELSIPFCVSPLIANKTIKSLNHVKSKETGQLTIDCYETLWCVIVMLDIVSETEELLYYKMCFWDHTNHKLLNAFPHPSLFPTTPGHNHNGSFLAVNAKLILPAFIYRAVSQEFFLLVSKHTGESLHCFPEFPL